MRAFPVGRRVSLSRVVLIPAIAALLATPVSNAEAQFGKLKKLGADAIKEKAKEKVAGKEAPVPAKEGATASAGQAASSESKPVNVTIDASQLDVMLAALTPMAADAEKATQAARVGTEHAAKLAIAEKCLADAQAAIVAGRKVPPQSNATSARGRELSKEANRLSTVALNASDKGDMRTGTFAQDSMNTVNYQVAALSIGAACKFEFTPAAVIELNLAGSGSESAPATPSQMLTDVRNTYTKYQFALLRERIALFALSSADPTVKVGKEGVFTDEERAALTARAAEIQKLTPFFKNGTLAWKGTGDLSKW